MQPFAISDGPFFAGGFDLFPQKKIPAQLKLLKTNSCMGSREEKIKQKLSTIIIKKKKILAQAIAHEEKSCTALK